MNDLQEAIRKKVAQEFAVGSDQGHITNIPVEKMIEIVYEVSKTTGENIYRAFKQFQFTDEEIQDYMKKRLSEN